MIRNTELAALLSARICHDLVSPVGAIVNGVGLMKDISGPDVADELAMIGQSAGRASSLLQFYRIAFGTAEQDQSHTARNVLENHARSLIGSPKVSFQMTGAEGAPLSRPEAQAFCLIVLCARALVGLRGSVEAALDPDPGTSMRATARSDRPLGNAEFVDILRGTVGPDSVPPRAVEFLLLGRAAERLRTRVDIETTETEATLTLARTASF